MNNALAKKKEFGDYQTSLGLAIEVCKKIKNLGFKPNTIIEPTCGTGNFIKAAQQEFKNNTKIIGIEINNQYLNIVKSHINESDKNNISLINDNFFTLDWTEILKNIEVPILFLGNLPWVTNSTIGSLNGKNLPQKANFHKLNGFDAMTGESNFDISEWMLIKVIELLKFIKNKNAYIAFLIKTSVARKLIKYIHKNKINCSNINIFNFDAKRDFDVSVNACLFTCDFSSNLTNTDCNVYENLHSFTPVNTLGFRDNVLLSDVKMATKINNLYSYNQKAWRSGIKHDCSKIMELTIKDDIFYNGFNEEVNIEDFYLYPLLKGSDIANNRMDLKRMVIITQKYIGEDTLKIQSMAPKTWNYLYRHKNTLDKRRSIIYKNKPPFSIFGIGEYSFSLWKIAISSLYKKLDFKLIGPINNKPVMLDDTVNFLAFDTQEKAEETFSLLNSNISKDFLSTHIFWDNKRPITIAILNKLDISKLKLHNNLCFSSDDAVKWEERHYWQF